MKTIFAYMLQTLTYPYPENNFEINLKAINNRFKHVCVFDSNMQINTSKYLHTSQIIAIGCTQELNVNSTQNALSQLQSFLNKKPGWVFGYLSYDLKNEIENLNSKNEDRLDFKTLYFFVPEVVIKINDSSVSVIYDDHFLNQITAQEIYSLCFQPHENKEAGLTPAIQIKSRQSKSDYLNSVIKLKQHIAKGDVYEINYCQEFFAENVAIDPVTAFEKLNTISKAPFSAFCRFYDKYALCASPERYMKKTGDNLISQPIKGTVRRSQNANEDEQLKSNLRNSSKERSENIMIVDLVRNDLSRIAKQGSVKVDELLGVYTYKQVHQLISTIRCEVKEDVSFTDIIKSTFPMGSMTGAPKVSSLKLIETYEHTKRGLYSGAIGYITPEGDFDFNVVIRSILYNADNKYLSFMVGSAITAKSNAEEEYDECRLKAKAMFEVFGINDSQTTV